MLIRGPWVQLLSNSPDVLRNALPLDPISTITGETTDESGTSPNGSLEHGFDLLRLHTSSPLLSSFNFVTSRMPPLFDLQSTTERVTTERQVQVGNSPQQAVFTETLEYHIRQFEVQLQPLQRFNGNPPPPSPSQPDTLDSDSDSDMPRLMSATDSTSSDSSSEDDLVIDHQTTIWVSSPAGLNPSSPPPSPPVQYDQNGFRGSA